MRQVSGVFASMVRALVGAQLQAGDAELQWPQTVIPTIPIGFSHEAFSIIAAGASATQPTDNSFLTHTIMSRAPAAGNQNTRPWIIGGGIWQINCDWYLSVPAAASAFGCQWAYVTRDLGTTFQTINVMAPPVPQAAFTTYYHTQHVVSVPQANALRCDVFIDNTAGATAAGINVFFNCRKLS